MIRVVLVDDDDRFRAVARRILAADGADVVAEAATGADALRAVAECRPAVVLLDVGLPDIDGLEVARRLGAGGDGPMVILISSRDVTYGRRVATGIAAGYLPKDELSLSAIMELIGSSS